ncbi:hypothetical protein COY07_00105 [Candidatus Peregrinibacteria bacterium CG_4_10_14_0_2_um_filter_43_11]|nr:MAG: hypothetical protein COY07_00105 [Candidatus Peregrinibacteria bacterium CG_4_10_14_0_2_um_filter_43_11]
MKTTLKEIIEVIAGYTFRNAIKGDENGNMYVVQAVDTYGTNDIDLKYLPKINANNTRSNAILKRNDVVLSCRGDFRASVYIADSDISIASSSLYIIRIKDQNKILPHFLSIYLNSKIGQKFIKKVETGATIKTVLKKDIESLPINIPAIKVQQEIIDLFKNCQKQSNMLLKKTILIHNIADGALNQILTKS